MFALDLIHINHLHILMISIIYFQSLIDICLAYSNKWRFNSAIAKSKCMISGANFFCRQPLLYMGSQHMEISTESDVLGIIFTKDGKIEKHVHKII